MFLENEKCCIEIKVDTCDTVDSADNRYYDMVLNPCHYKRNNLSKTFSIHVNLFEYEFYIALIGSFYSYDLDCAILD